MFMNWFKVVEVLLKILTFGLSTWKACKEEEQEKENVESKEEKEDGKENE